MILGLQGNFKKIQNEDERQVDRSVAHYNLQMIITVDIEVNNDRTVRFRK